MSDDLLASTNLTRRGLIWHFCLRVPGDLVPAFGKPRVQFTLGTRDEVDARRRDLVHMEEYRQRFAEVRACQGRIDAPVMAGTRASLHAVSLPSPRLHRHHDFPEMGSALQVSEGLRRLVKAEHAVDDWPDSVIGKEGILAAKCSADPTVTPMMSAFSDWMRAKLGFGPDPVCTILPLDATDRNDRL